MGVETHPLMYGGSSRVVWFSVHGYTMNTYIRKGMKLELKLDYTGRTSDVDMTTMGIPVGHFTTSGSWTATDDDILLLVDMRIVNSNSPIPWIRAVRKAASARYGHTPGLKLVHDMWKHIVKELDAGHISCERRVVYTTAHDTESGREEVDSEAGSTPWFYHQ